MDTSQSLRLHKVSLAFNLREEEGRGRRRERRERRKTRKKAASSTREGWNKGLLASVSY